MSFFDFEELDGEAVGSASEVLESIGADLSYRGRGITAQEIVSGFLESTPMLTFEEHAALIGGLIHDRRATLSAAASSRSSRTAPHWSEDLGSIEINLGNITAGLSKAASLFQQGAQVVQQFRSPSGSRPPGSTSPRGASPSGRTSSGSGNIFSDIASGISKGVSLFQQGAQVAQQFRSPPWARRPAAAPAPPPTAPPMPPPAEPEPAAPPIAVPTSIAAPTPIAASEPAAPLPAAPAPLPTAAPTAVPGQPPPVGTGAMGQAQAGVDALGAMWQALRQGQIPLLPGQLPGGTGAGQLAPPPMATMSGGRPPADATALLALFLGLPQLQSALQSAAVLGPAGPRTMELPIPAAGPPGSVRNLQIPLGAVMNTLAALASRSMEELNASTQDSDPEIPDYLVDEDGRFLVDPDSAADRARLLNQMVRLHQAAQRAGWFEAREADEGQDEAEAWARDAGFERWESP